MYISIYINILLLIINIDFLCNMHIEYACIAHVACTKIPQCECGLHKDTAVSVWLAQRYCSVSVASTKILQCECGLHKDTAV